jgi:hypothetical protein
MKGLDWFQVQTDIAWDNDIEHVSDAEFRTFLELLAMSAYRLSDGLLMQRDCIKHLNTRRPADALRALSAHGYITLDAETITIHNYGKYQVLREEVEERRAKQRDRVRRYRQRSNSEVSEQSKSKSNIPPIVPRTKTSMSSGNSTLANKVKDRRGRHGRRRSRRRRPQRYATPCQSNCPSSHN